jgi:hypothetical protein
MPLPLDPALPLAEVVELVLPVAPEVLAVTVLLAPPELVPDDVAPDGPALEEPPPALVVPAPLLPLRLSPAFAPGGAPLVGWEPQAATMRAAHKPMTDATFMGELRSSGARSIPIASRPALRGRSAKMSGPPSDQTVS